MSKGKIKQLQTQINQFKAKYPQRNWEQISYLNCLYLELGHWILIERARIKPIIQTWEKLKEHYEANGKWPLTNLKAFLLSQKPEYWLELTNLIEKENNPSSKKLVKNLAKWTKLKTTKLAQDSAEKSSELD